MGSINIFNFENQIVSSDDFYKFFVLATIVFGFIKVAHFIYKKAEIKENSGLKVLKIKRYSVEILQLSIIYCFLIPVSNHFIFYIGFKFINYDTEISNVI